MVHAPRVRKQGPLRAARGARAHKVRRGGPRPCHGADARGGGAAAPRAHPQEEPRARRRPLPRKCAAAPANERPNHRTRRDQQFCIAPHRQTSARTTGPAAQAAFGPTDTPGQAGSTSKPGQTCYSPVRLALIPSVGLLLTRSSPSPPPLSEQWTPTATARSRRASSRAGCTTSRSPRATRRSRRSFASLTRTARG